MGEQRAPITVAGLGDLHVAETPGHPYRDLFAEIAGQADVLALCGDLTNLGTPRQAEILAQDLRTLPIPVVGVLGNHDLDSGHDEEVAAILRDAGLHLLERDGVRDVHGVGFAGAKGFAGGFGRGMLASFGEPAMKRFVQETENEARALENALRALDNERIVVVLHYAPVAGTVEGEPREIYPFLGSSRFGETIDRFNVRAVLHGHAHHGTYRGHTTGGIPVYNCAQAVAKDSRRPYALITV